MTKLPLEDRAVEGIEGPPYPLNEQCPVPGCGDMAHERHHIWRRSFLIGDYAWVKLPDGRAVGNLVKLCNRHHHMVTTNAAWISLEEGRFVWSDLMTASQALVWQPPSELDKPDVISNPDPEITVNLVEEGICPKCLRPLPHPKSEREPARVRRTWSVTVPLDSRENGAESLDTLLEAAREEMAKAGLPYGDEDAVKFFVLSGALGLFVTHAKDVLT